MTMAEERSAMPPSPAIDIVICTYNRASGLDLMLENLSRQSCGDHAQWRILVVDNASTDATAEVVAKHHHRALLQDLRYVFEPMPGLTAARLRGARETTAPWIAFVDDDNFLEPTWLEAVTRAIGMHGDAGGIGGKVILDWEANPPRYLKEFAFCFAAQDHGEADCIVDSLAGAGMVISRRALQDCGWLDQPLVADRVGAKLTSGGDVEMAQRVRAAGYDLWFVPDAVLRHRIPASRMTRRYLFRINRELGTSSAVIGLLTWPEDWQSWQRMALERRRHWYGLAMRGLRHAVRRRTGFTPAIAWACFALGFARGVRQCRDLAGSRRAKLLGAAALHHRGDSQSSLPA
ncbi:MAG: glycosyl transferase family 2 [Rhodospirillum sp.]|nr:glycosyl transferase family 2 [Rhodospirillum sp.]